MGATMTEDIIARRGIDVSPIILSSSESDFLDQLIPLLKNAETQTQVTPLIHALNHVSADREAEIEKICNDHHQEFISSVDQLQLGRQGTVELTTEIMKLSRSIEATTEKLAEQKRALVDSRGVRQNIDDATDVLKECLEALHLAHEVQEQLRLKNHYAALRALNELQSVHLPKIARYKIAETIERSIPDTQRFIADATMADLNTWLFRIRETSQFLGEVAFYHTELRRTRQKNRSDQDPYIGSFKLNSVVELVADESEEFDVLDNEDVQVDFSPLFECLRINTALGETEKFRAHYAANRRLQKDLLIPQTLIPLDDENGSLSSLLEGITGFAIVEKATMQKTENFRAQSDVDELWDSMCQSAVTLISDALHSVDNDDKLLKIKGVMTLFIQTMDSWGYSVSSLDSLLLTLFEKYSALLKKRFSDDFEEIVSSDDYMPMPINDAEEYTKVISVSWYTPPNGQERPEDLTYPCVLPFSQMYPLVCIDIRNFLNQIYLFSDDHFRHATVIDKTLKDSLDELLSNKVCGSLVERLSSQYPGQIVQILTNLDHFERACKDLELLLVEARSSSSAAGPITLQATSKFNVAKQRAEKRIFELVNSKIDDLIETAEYNWNSTYVPKSASEYIQELTRYLSNIMSSVLLGLPEQVKRQIYTEALVHTSNAMLALPLDAGVRQISPQSVTAYKLDVAELTDFVNTLPSAASLRPILDELSQTTDLMTLLAAGDGEEFFDPSKSRDRFSKVDKIKGAELLEKVAAQPTTAAGGPGSAAASAAATKPDRMSILPDLRDRFGQFTKRA